jgi:hypothetical protein
MAGPPILLLLMILMAVLTAAPGHADRLYQWTDKSGTTHLTQDPPPAEGDLQDVMDYTHEPAPQPKAVPERRPKYDKDGGVDTRPVLTEAEAARKIREDRAMALDNFCFLQAPGIDVYVRVWEPNDYGERGPKIWSGLVPKNQQQKVSSQSGRIIYDYQKRQDGPFGGQSTVPCSGGGVVQLLR